MPLLEVVGEGGADGEPNLREVQRLELRAADLGRNAPQPLVADLGLGQREVPQAARDKPGQVVAAALGEPRVVGEVER